MARTREVHKQVRTNGNLDGEMRAQDTKDLAEQENGLLPEEDRLRNELTPNDSTETPARQKVIKFSNVSKRFTLHHERARSFQDIVVSLFGLRTPSRRGVAMPRPAHEIFWALQEVNFGVYAGEAIGIIGENGSGKSTTLKLISRILEPTSGSVSVKGKVSALLELGTGFHPELTGRENIFLNGSLLGIPRKEMVERYQSIVDFAELDEFIDTPIKHYSSGMVMRLGFAVAINVDPDILLTDEVLAVGDEAFQRKCLDYIAALRRRGITIVFVSHALDSVRSLCQRTVWLDHGKVVADGPTAEVIDKYLAFENEKHADRVRIAMESRSDGAEPGSTRGTGAENTEAGSPTDARAAKRAEITGATFLNDEGNEHEVFQTGQPLTIRIAYDAHDRVENPVFGLAIYTQAGVHLNGPNTKFAGVDIPAIEGTGYVEYSITELPLLAGVYDITVALTGADIGDVLDHQHRAYSFHVQPTPGLAERWGLLHIPATWTFHPGDGEPAA